MTTPIADFVRAYTDSGVSRLHMPGHKGRGPLGFEGMDITEVRGADALYEAEGIIGESERNASELFGSARTVYSTEGSSQCIRAMLHLVLSNRREGTPPVVVAARNVHKAFVYAAALLDCEVIWLYPDESAGSICSCPVLAGDLERVLQELPFPPAAVYLTSPDYLGGMAELSALAEVCHDHHTVLAVDNAHGAYLRFLPRSAHPLDLGADVCCDSAHKTLPVLTGGAYLHVANRAPAVFAQQAKRAMELFGSTSPSYLTLTSLDLCNRWLKEEARASIQACVMRLELLRAALTENGWRVRDTDPLRVTVCAPEGESGEMLALRLRRCGVECEYADPEHLVLMATPHNTEEDFRRVSDALGINSKPYRENAAIPVARGERAMSIRQAVFAPCETVPVSEGLGRICACPTVSCPPAIPIAVSGEVIGPEEMELFTHYGVTQLDVVK